MQWICIWQNVIINLMEIQIHDAFFCLYLIGFPFLIFKLSLPCINNFYQTVFDFFSRTASKYGTQEKLRNLQKKLITDINLPAISLFCSIWSSTSAFWRSRRYFISLSKSPIESERISSKSRSKLRMSRGTTWRMFRIRVCFT